MIYKLLGIVVKGTGRMKFWRRLSPPSRLLISWARGRSVGARLLGRTNFPLANSLTLTVSNAAGSESRRRRGDLEGDDENFSGRQTTNLRLSSGLPLPPFFSC